MVNPTPAAIGAVTEDVPAVSPETANGEGDRCFRKRAVRMMVATNVSAVFAIAGTSLNLPWSLNYILEGDAQETSGKAQRIFAICFFCKQASSLLFASLVGELGNVIGRKRVGISCVFVYALVAAISLVATVVLRWRLFIVAQFGLGIFAPLQPTSLAYIVDAAPADWLQKGVAFYAGGMTFGAFSSFMVALITIVLLEENQRAQLIIQYIVCTAVPGLAFLPLLFLLPDISPALKKRRPFRWQEGVPLYMLVDMRKWTGYMRLAYFQEILCAEAAPAAFQSYLVNYAIKRYGFSLRDTAVLVAALFLLAAVTGATTLRFMRLKILLPWCYCISLFAQLSYMLLPSKKIVIWLVAAVSTLGAAQPHALITVFLAQGTETERGALTGALKTGGALGRMVGAGVGGVIAQMWFDSEKLQQDFPGLPAVTPLTFQFFGFVLFIINEFTYGHQNKMKPSEVITATIVEVVQPKNGEGKVEEI
jgi:MFS family permease